MKKQPKTTCALSSAEILRIAGQAEISPNTVRSWASGKSVKPISLMRINRAVEFLNSTRGKAS